MIALSFLERERERERGGGKGLNFCVHDWNLATREWRKGSNFRVRSHTNETHTYKVKPDPSGDAINIRNTLLSNICKLSNERAAGASLTNPIKRRAPRDPC